MQADTWAGMIYAFLDDYTGKRVCSKQLYAEALDHINQPQSWEAREICEIMNSGIRSGAIRGWRAHTTAKRYAKYGFQKGWERIKDQETVNVDDDLQFNLAVKFRYTSGYTAKAHQK